MAEYLYAEIVNNQIIDNIQLFNNIGVIVRMSGSPKPFTTKTPKTQKSLLTGHNLPGMHQIPSFQSYQPCPIHENNCLTHVCVDCNYQCLCGLCLQQGKHCDHIIKSIDKGSRIVDRILNEYLIRLRSKSDLLSLLKENLRIHSSQLYNGFMQYLQIINDNFSVLANDLITKRDSLIARIKQYYHHRVRNINKNKENVGAEQQRSLQLIELISDRIQKLQPASICMFFSESRNQIEQVLDQDRAKYESFRNAVPDVEWSANLKIFEGLRDKIKLLDLQESKKQIQLVMDQGKNNECKVISKSHSRKHSESKCCITKTAGKYNQQPNKNIRHYMKSPTKKLRKCTQSSKLMSMPDSPSKNKIINHNILERIDHVPSHKCAVFEPNRKFGKQKK